MTISQIKKIVRSIDLSTESAMSISGQLSDQLMWLIANGTINENDQLPAMRDLADSLGISIHTVRAAYKHLEELSLVERIEREGSFVKVLNRPMLLEKFRYRKTHTVGIILPDLSNPFFPEFLRGVEDVARKNQILLFTCNTEDQISQGNIYLDQLIARQVDGLIITPFGLVFDSQKGKLDKENEIPMPVVYVGRPEESKNSIIIDANSVGSLAIRHLYEHGHKRIGIIACGLEYEANYQYIRGCNQEFKKLGIDFNEKEIIIAESYSIEAGYKAGMKYLKMKDRPSAIFAVGDILAIGFMKAMKEKGVLIPEEVALVGFNNIQMADIVTPSLTTVATQIREMGSCSMKMLINLISGSQTEQSQIIMPVNLIVRKSCGCGGKDS